MFVSDIHNNVVSTITFIQITIISNHFHARFPQKLNCSMSLY